jgi:RNA polymerase sigma-32 factor
MALDMGGEQSLSRRAMKAELLDAETELRLAYAWRDDRDEEALHRLVTAYMRLAISMAAKFKRYGAPMNDLIQEAGLGLMKAADKFDPDRGVRFSTYAVWWIKASIQDYVMRNWSMVRTGSTSSQKSLFFNMRRVQARLEREALANGEMLDKHQLRQLIATEVGVPLHDVEMMEGRLAGSDFSLNATQSVDDEGREWIDTLEDDSQQAAETVEHAHDTETSARVARQRDGRAERAGTLHRAGTQAARGAADAGKPRQRAGPVEGARAPAGGRGVRQDAQDAGSAVEGGPVIPRHLILHAPLGFIALLFAVSLLSPLPKGGLSVAPSSFTENAVGLAAPNIQIAFAD